MPSGSHNESLQVGNAVFNRAVNDTADNANIYGDSVSPIVMAVATPVVAADYVKDTANTGHGNLTALHGLTTGVYDVYWADGIQYSVTCAITINAYTFASGVGDDLPANGTAIWIRKVTDLNITIDGDLASMV